MTKKKIVLFFLLVSALVFCCSYSFCLTSWLWKRRACVYVPHEQGFRSLWCWSYLSSIQEWQSIISLQSAGCLEQVRVIEGQASFWKMLLQTLHVGPDPFLSGECFVLISYRNTLSEPRLKLSHKLPTWRHVEAFPGSCLCRRINPNRCLREMKSL